jgi:hypothetical protein
MPMMALRYFYLGQCVHICDLTSNMSVYISTPAVSGAPDVRSVVRDTTEGELVGKEP